MADLRTVAQWVLDEWRDDPGSVRMASLMIALKNAVFEYEQRAINAAELQEPHSADCWRWHHECAISKIQWMRVPLTTQQVDDLLTSGAWSAEGLVRAVERAHGIVVSTPK